MVHDTNPFTSDPVVLRRQLDALKASGGGDGPEAQIDGLDAVLRSPFRQDAQRVVFLITDSPPHGIGEPGDVVPKSHPSALTAKKIMDSFKARNTILIVVGCTPTINYYKKAVQFYKDFAESTGGFYLPLTDPSKDSGPMSRAIVGSVLAASDTLRLTDAWGGWIRDESHRGHAALASAMHSKLSSDGEKCHEVTCTEHGGHDVKYHLGPVSRARVDTIVSKSLRDQEEIRADPVLNALFG